MTNCPCGSGQPFDACCSPILSGAQSATTAEALMRSRYAAYVMQQIPYLGETLHPEHRNDWDELATRRWAESAEWLRLEIRNTEGGGEQDDEGIVEFIATFREKGQTKRHHEVSRFQRHDGRWYYVDGVTPKPETQRHEGPRVGRNDPCPCGSGKKYKKCCGV